MENRETDGEAEIESGLSNDDDREMVGVEDPHRGDSTEPQDAHENQPKEVAMITVVPELEDAGDGDPQGRCQQT